MISDLLTMEVYTETIKNWILMKRIHVSPCHDFMQPGRLFYARFWAPESFPLSSPALGVFLYSSRISSLNNDMLSYGVLLYRLIYSFLLHVVTRIYQHVLVIICSIWRQIHSYSTHHSIMQSYTAISVDHGGATIDAHKWSKAAAIKTKTDFFAGRSTNHF